nr:MAG TPA: hypothetical protein [Caudoviricetes sp.]
MSTLHMHYALRSFAAPVAYISNRVFTMLYTSITGYSIIVYFYL